MNISWLKKIKTVIGSVLVAVEDKVTYMQFPLPH